MSIFKTATAAVAAMWTVLALAASPVDGFPSRPIKILVGAPPGGVNDTVVRIVAQRMELGQPVIVENRNGASSMIAAEMTAKAAPDGTTLLLASQTVVAVSPIINHVTSFNAQKDFAAVALIGSAPLVLIAGPALPASTVREVIAVAKSKPGELDFGSGGVGTSPYMAASLFGVMTGTKLSSIPYPGEQAAMTEIMAGRLPMMFASAATAMQHVKGGRLRGIAVTSSQRVNIAPGLPTVAEAGVPGYEAGTWFGLIAPAATPKPVIDRINAEVNRVLALPDVKAKLEDLGFSLSRDTPEQFSAYMKTEYAKWSKLIVDANIKAE